MNEDVMISVRGLQFLENNAGDSLETVQRGKYYFRNGSHFLLYDEYMEDGGEPVKNLLRIQNGELSLTKKGPIHVQMLFLEGKKNLAQYRTPFGAILIGLDTRRVACESTPEALLLEVDYTLEANYQYVADCQIRIEAKPAGGEQIAPG